MPINDMVLRHVTSSQDSSIYLLVYARTARVPSGAICQVFAGASLHRFNSSCRPTSDQKRLEP